MYPNVCIYLTLTFHIECLLQQFSYRFKEIWPKSLLLESHLLDP